jgi:hypothetical protein
MFERKNLAVTAAMLALLALTACNIGKAPEPTPDVNALYTQAAETLVAQFNEQQTQTAQAATPTPQPSPTAPASPSPFPTFALPGLTPLGTLVPGLTVLPTTAAGGAVSFPVGCDDAKFVGETVPDKTKIDAQKDFKKAWSMLNSGTCTWDEGYTFAFKSGERLSGTDIKIIKEEDFTKPGESQAFVVNLKAPNKVGEFIGFWQMRNDSGIWFGSLVSVDIIVD